MPDKLLSTDELITRGDRIAAAIKADHAAAGARLRAQDAAWLADHPPPRPQAQQPSGEVYDAATREWVNPLTGTRRHDASTWVPDLDQRAIKPPSPEPVVDPEPDTLHVHVRNGATSVPEPLPQAPPGTLLLLANTNLERRFLRLPQDVNPSDSAIARPAEQPAIPVLPADFNLQEADDYEVSCFIWLKLSPSEKFTLATFQQHCRGVFGIGLQKAKRLHHYLEACGSLILQRENRPRRRPIRWYWRAARPPTRLPDQAEVDDIDDDDGLE